MDTEEYDRWGGHGHYEDHGTHRGCHPEGCHCRCHRHHGEMGFHRRFISQEEMGAQLEEYLKQLRAEAKGVEERIAELKKKREPQQT
jgi:hypothetical protein